MMNFGTGERGGTWGECPSLDLVTIHRDDHFCECVMRHDGGLKRWESPTHARRLPSQHGGGWPGPQGASGRPHRHVSRRGYTT